MCRIMTLAIMIQNCTDMVLNFSCIASFMYKIPEKFKSKSEKFKSIHYSSIFGTCQYSSHHPMYRHIEKIIHMILSHSYPIFFLIFKGFYFSFNWKTQLKLSVSAYFNTIFRLKIVSLQTLGPR